MYNEGVVDVPELDRLTGVFGLRAWVSIFFLENIADDGEGGAGSHGSPLYLSVITYTPLEGVRACQKIVDLVRS